MRQDFTKLLKQIVRTHGRMVAEFEAAGIEIIIVAARAITAALRKGRTIYTCGNGGSAADAQHIAAELIGRFETDRKALRAIALTTDTSVITSISNDYGYERFFARQVEALVEKNDILWAISTSGNSKNVLAAAELAKEKGALVLAFTGRKNSKLQELADICLCAESSSTARSQEIHQLAYHMICAIVEQSLCEYKKP